MILECLSFEVHFYARKKPIDRQRGRETSKTPNSAGDEHHGVFRPLEGSNRLVASENKEFLQSNIIKLQKRWRDFLWA